MQKSSVLTRALALIGAILAWIPIVAPLAFALRPLIRASRLQIDYLMPAEIFPVALAGAGLLLWAAIRARSRRAPIGWGLVVMLGALGGSMGGAVLTGLASGAQEASGWRLILVASLMALYVLALIEVAVSGILLVRDTLSKRAQGEAPAQTAD